MRCRGPCRRSRGHERGPSLRPAIVRTMNAAPPVLTLRRLDSSAPDFDAALNALTAFDVAQDPAVDATVASIVAGVRTRGDAALLEYTERFDRLRATNIDELAIDAAAMRAAWHALGG